MNGDSVEVRCACGHRFRALASLKGGLTNCPACGKATSVAGGPEPLFWVLLGAGAFVALAIAAGVWAAAGPIGGLIALAVVGAILGAIVLAS